jgi:integrase
MKRITSDASAKAARVAEGRQVEYPDAKIPGLALRVTPAGGKSWSLRYRNNGGDQRRLTLGPYPTITLSKARKLAQAAMGQVADGADPAKTKQESRAAVQARKLSTVSALIESYLDDAAIGRHKPNSRPKRQGTLKLEREYFDRVVGPRFGKLPLSSLTRHDVQRMLDEVGARAPASARHCRNLIRQAYNYAIRREVAAANPAQFTELPGSRQRERVLADDELRLIWTAAKNPRSFKGVNISPATGLAICLGLVTLQRGGEVCGIHAREIDRERMLWIIPGERTKNHHTHVVPLSSVALDLLERAFAANMKDAITWTGFAFPSPRGEGSLSRHAFSRAMNRLTVAVGIADATAHDFRRTGSTNITSERIGMPRFIVSRVLNHISDTGDSAVVTAVYDRNAYLPEKRRALTAWAALLQEIVERRDRLGNVMQLARK